MIVKGEIQSIDYSGNTCVVRMPYFESAADTGSVTATATFSNQPGCYNGYKEGDMVWVAFEDGEAHSPCVIGKLYLGVAKEKQEARGAVNCDSLTTGSKNSLPLSTEITNDSSVSTVSTSVSLTSYKTLSDVLTAVSNNTNKLSNLKSDSESADATISSNVSSLAVKVENNTAQVAVNTAQVAKNTADVATNTAQVAKNTADVATLTAEVAQQTAEVAKNTADVATLTSEVAKNTADVAVLTADVADKTAEIADISADINQQSADINGISVKIQESTVKSMSLMRTAVATAYDGIDDVNDILDQMDAIIDEANGEVETSGALAATSDGLAKASASLAVNARKAANDAQESADEAASAATLAVTYASDAVAAATLALISASTAAYSAEQSAIAAGTASYNAEAAVEAATLAISAATIAAEYANRMAIAAGTASYNANEAAANANASRLWVMYSAVENPTSAESVSATYSETYHYMGRCQSATNPMSAEPLDLTVYEPWINLLATDGEDAYAIVLSNDYDSIPATSEGTVGSYDWAGQTGHVVTVLQGTEQKSFAVSNETPTANGDALTIVYSLGDGISADSYVKTTEDDSLAAYITALTEDTSYISYKLYKGTALVDSAKFSVAKIKAGAKGDNLTRSTSGSFVKYATSSSGTTAPSESDFSESIAEVADGDYLWTWTHTEYSDGTNSDEYSAVRDPEDGKAGRGIARTDIAYAIGDDGVSVPETWQDQSEGVPAVAEGKFLWTRTTITYTEADEDENTTSVSYSTAKQGKKGDKGDSAVYLSIDNDFDSVPADSNGKVGEYQWQSQTTHHLKVFSGATQQNFTLSTSAPSSGSAYTVVYENKGFGSVTAAMDGDNVATVYVTNFADGKDVASIEYTVYLGAVAVATGKFEASKIIAGENGDDAVDYYLTVTPSEIKYNKNADTLTDKITAEFWSQTGAGDPAACSNCYISYQIGSTVSYTNGVSSLQLSSSGSTDTYSKDDGQIIIKMYKDADHKLLLDTETVSIVADGADGTTMIGSTISYATNASGITPPASWSTTIVSVPDGDYLWTRTETFYSNSSIPVTSYSVAKDPKNGVDGRGISGTTIYYGVDSQGTTVPTGITWTEMTGSNSVPTVKEGQYLWTKTVITYTEADENNNTTSESYSVSKQGESVTDYYLTVTPNVVKFDGTTTLKSGSPITIKAMKRIGGGTPAEATDCYWEISSNGTVKKSGTSSSVTLTNGDANVGYFSAYINAGLQVSLYNNSTDKVLYDSETIDVVKDGTNGGKGADGDDGTSQGMLFLATSASGLNGCGADDISLPTSYTSLDPFTSNGWQTTPPSPSTSAPYVYVLDYSYDGTTYTFGTITTLSTLEGMVDILSDNGVALITKVNNEYVMHAEKLTGTVANAVEIAGFQVSNIGSYTVNASTDVYGSDATLVYNPNLHYSTGASTVTITDTNGVSRVVATDRVDCMASAATVGVYIGTDGIRLGNKFAVNTDGTIYAEDYNTVIGADPDDFGYVLCADTTAGDAYSATKRNGYNSAASVVYSDIDETNKLNLYINTMSWVNSQRTYPTVSIKDNITYVADNRSSNAAIIDTSKKYLLVQMSTTPSNSTTPITVNIGSVGYYFTKIVAAGGTPTLHGVLNEYIKAAGCTNQAAQLSYRSGYYYALDVKTVSSGTVTSATYSSTLTLKAYPVSRYIMTNQGSGIFARLSTLETLLIEYGLIPADDLIMYSSAAGSNLGAKTFTKSSVQITSKTYVTDSNITTDIGGGPATSLSKLTITKAA